MIPKLLSILLPISLKIFNLGLFLRGSLQLTVSTIAVIISGKEYLSFWTIMNEMMAYLPGSKTKTTKLQRSLNIHKMQNFYWKVPILIVDGTFQPSKYRGTMIIVMVISSHRTNIQIAWGLSLSENSELIRMILNLIKEVQPNIKTFISEQGKSIKKSNDEIFSCCTSSLSRLAFFPKNQKIKNRF